MKLILIGNAHLFALSSCTPMYVAHGYRAACLINYEYNPPALFVNDFQRAVKLCQLLRSVMVFAIHLKPKWQRGK